LGRSCYKGFKGNWFSNFNLSGTYWDKQTDNAIWPTDAAPSTGTGSIIDNAFGLSARGTQISLSTTAYTSKNIKWNFTANFSRQNSEITAVKDKPVVILSNAGSSGYVLEAGKRSVSFLVILCGMLLTRSSQQLVIPIYPKLTRKTLL
jgi:hypothetical protein